MMTSKQLLLATLRGEKTERVAWAPFLTYWWDSNLVYEAEKKGELGFKRSVGCDLLMRGHYDRPTHNNYNDMFTFRASYGKTQITEKIEGNKKYQIYKTPVGDIIATYTYSTSGSTWFLTSHPIKREQDFKVLRYITQDRILESDMKYLEASQKDSDALFLPLITPFTKTGFQSMIEYWVGTEEMAYALADIPEQVEETLKVIWELSDQSARKSADSQAEAFISWEDTSTTNISPDWYKRYILPEINNWCDILHAKGKLYVQHACGHLRALVPLIAQSKIDAIESVSSPPTGNITPIELCSLLPSHITVIGGIEPLFFEKADDSELIDMVRCELNELKGKRFILANADSCPPGVDINRFGLVTKVVYEEFQMDEPSIEAYTSLEKILPRGMGTYHGSTTTN